MSEQSPRETADAERERREHEEEARRREPHEREDGAGDDAAERGGPPANIQPGTNTGS
jgi:hypothetical protein